MEGAALDHRVAEGWAALDEGQKQEYEDMAASDQARYLSETAGRKAKAAAAAAAVHATGPSGDEGAPKPPPKKKGKTSRLRHAAGVEADKGESDDELGKVAAPPPTKRRWESDDESGEAAPPHNKHKWESDSEPDVIAVPTPSQSPAPKAKKRVVVESDEED